jgi:RND family efflux transporter MFP subunit
MRAIVLALLTQTMISGTMISGTMISGSIEAAPIAMGEAERQAFGITVAAPEVATDIYSHGLPAQVVVPNAQLRVVSARQGGLIERLLVAVGDEVKAGQVLATVQSPELLDLQGDFLKAATRLRLARANYERDRQLFEEGVIPERRLLKTQGTYQELATVQSARREALRLAGMSEAEVRALEADRRLMSELTVVSPLDGVVLEQIAVAGQRVEAASPLYRVATLKPLWLEIHVPIEGAEQVTVGQSVLVPEYDVTGRVITIGRDVHEADQGVLVRARVDAGSESLRPGQFIQVRVAGTHGPGQRLRVLRTSVVHSGDKALVFLETPEGFTPQEVEVVSDQGDRLVIAAPLPEGARIATTGTAALKAALARGE